ncbi:unnamed protein product [Sphacelaria rigidula]
MRVLRGRDEVAVSTKTEERETSSAPMVVPVDRTCGVNRLSHMPVCSLCDEEPLNKRVIFCRNCPRIMCLSCARSSNSIAEHPVIVVSPGSNACRSEMEMRKCLSCIHDGNGSLPAPPTVATSTDQLLRHLVQTLVEHDLSREFRKPVDTEMYPDYLYKVGRGHMMDLQTIMDKLNNGKYSTRRGRSMFKEDLSRIWRNCRYYAECDEQGIPLDGTLTPGIVRCALILERMVSRFYARYMPDADDVVLPTTSWDGWRQAKALENERARLQLSEDRANKMAAEGGDDSSDHTVPAASSISCSPPSRFMYDAKDTVSNGGNKESVATVCSLVSVDGTSSSSPVSTVDPINPSAVAHPAVQFVEDHATATEKRNFERKDDVVDPKWTLWYKLCEASVEFNEMSVLEVATRPSNLRGQDADRGDVA